MSALYAVWKIIGIRGAIAIALAAALAWFAFVTVPHLRGQVATAHAATVRAETVIGQQGQRIADLQQSMRDAQSVNASLQSQLSQYADAERKHSHELEILHRRLSDAQEKLASVKGDSCLDSALPADLVRVLRAAGIAAPDAGGDLPAGTSGHPTGGADPVGADVRPDHVSQSGLVRDQARSQP